MAANGRTLTAAALTLRQFLHRQKVLTLYRKILRAIYQMPNEADQLYLKKWARQEFKQNKNATDPDTVRMMLTHGNLQLQELEKMLRLAK
ncbi:LYR motif-containing protein 2 [Callorhinchus milii]|uniref:LYR motif-containing protein 2 n=1 Tax=Callorhinchus milii TaxID=7868 RepID=K4FSR2_CALMI|nr:LYR motif-containing protein 2 [Callorhinchus milii]AFK11128.1 LYR motif-containing protein 2-like protein [Callorhinchus milii]|eukprot:gi/632970576/ref/XP_007901725.1/ PREDICTED: LYR motif-containing protein 2 [Callorhinchus milii]